MKWGKNVGATYTKKSYNLSLVISKYISNKVGNDWKNVQQSINFKIDLSRYN